MILGRCKFCNKTFRKREVKYKFCSLSCANNFNKNGLKRISLPSKSEELAEFVGICLGDGYVDKYQIAITLNAIADKDYIPYVANLVSHLFPNIKISFIKKTNQHAIDIRLNSSLVAKFMYEMGLVPRQKKLPLWITEDVKYTFACVRGLFDTEGSISLKQYTSKKGVNIYKQLHFRNTNIQLITFVRDTLLSLRLHPTMTLKKSLYLTNHKSIDTFRKSIGFSNPKLQTRSLIYTVNHYHEWQKKNQLFLRE